MNLTFIKQTLASFLCRQKTISSVNHFLINTALFPGFKVIFAKMKKQKQPFITQNTIFCACGNIQSITLKYFKIKNNIFKQGTMPRKLDSVVTIIKTYQFPGSLSQLQSILNIHADISNIPTEYYQPCECSNPTVEQHVQDIETAIMAFFAQHPQFTNGASIDFEGLGLLNSNLKKEYDDLLTLKGFSVKDMSIFHIDHMYASTIQEIRLSTQALQASLHAQKKQSSAKRLIGKQIFA